jgi:hypothetical protein
MDRRAATSMRSCSRCESLFIAISASTLRYRTSTSSIRVGFVEPIRSAKRLPRMTVNTSRGKSSMIRTAPSLSLKSDGISWRTKPFRATATPPTMMNLTSARASVANNFSYGVSIVGLLWPRKLCHEPVQAIKPIPNVASSATNSFFHQLVVGGCRHLIHLIAASFFKSTRLIQSCNSFGSWFCNSI